MYAAAETRTGRIPNYQATRKIVKLLVVCFIVLGTITVAAPAATPAASVITFAGDCNTASGCAVASPTVWIPDRIPRLGTSLTFSRIRWQYWGTGLAEGEATATGCVSGGGLPSVCWHGTAGFHVYVLGDGVYECLRIVTLQSSDPGLTRSLVNAETAIGATSSDSACANQYPVTPSRLKNGAWKCANGNGGYGPIVQQTTGLTCTEAVSLALWLIGVVSPPNGDATSTVARKALARPHRGTTCTRTSTFSSGSFQCMDRIDNASFDWAYGSGGG